MKEIPEKKNPAIFRGLIEVLSFILMIQLQILFVIII